MLGVNGGREMDAVGGLAFHPRGWRRAEQLPPLLKCFYFSPNREESSSSFPALAISTAEAPARLPRGSGINFFR